MRVYGMVTTRCFGWSVQSTCMIPFCDSFNHNDCATVNGLFDPNLHLEATPEYKLSDRMEYNYMQYFEEKNIDLNEEYIDIVRGSEVFPESKPQSEIESKFNSISDDPDSHIWNIGYESSECDEDNDTMEDWDEEEEATQDTSAALSPEEEKKDSEYSPEKLEAMEGLRPL